MQFYLPVSLLHDVSASGPTVLLEKKKIRKLIKSWETLNLSDLVTQWQHFNFSSLFLPFWWNTHAINFNCFPFKPDSYKILYVWVTGHLLLVPNKLKERFILSLQGWRWWESVLIKIK